MAILAYGSVLFALSTASFPKGDIGIFIAFALLPVINAVFDWLSYGTTIALLRAGYRRKRFWPFLCGVLDVVLAAVFFGLLSFAVIVSFHLLNTLRGEELIDIGDLLRGIRDEPKQHLWIVAMVASTLLPTLVHLGVACISAILFIPRSVWNWLIAHLDLKKSYVFSGLAVGGYAALVMICVSLPTMLLGFGVFGLWTHGASLRELYADRLLVVAFDLGML